MCVARCVVCDEVVGGVRLYRVRCGLGGVWCVVRYVVWWCGLARYGVVW